MDPNENLRRLRYCSSKILDESLSERKRSEYADETAELFHALDQWIVSGGFLPERWSQGVRKLPGE